MPAYYARSRNAPIIMAVRKFSIQRSFVERDLQGFLAFFQVVHQQEEGDRGLHDGDDYS
jgi:hypothetical protein